MFPHEQGPQNSRLLRKHSLPPLRLPKQRCHLKNVGGSISFRDQNSDNSRYLHDTILPDHQCFRSRNQRPRGGSLEEEESVCSRTMLPSMASLLPSHNFHFQHDNSFDATTARQHFHQQVSSLKQVSSTRHQVQLPSHERTQSAVVSASSSTNASDLQVQSTPFTGLSALPIQPTEMQRNRFAMSPTNRQNRWSPYASTWVSVARERLCDPIVISWEHAEHPNKQQKHPQRRRTSPRRRLAASKVRAQAFQMQELAEVFDHFENNRIGYDPAKKNDGPRFVPSFSTVSSELQLPILQPPILINDSNTSQNNQRIELHE